MSKERFVKVKCIKGGKYYKEGDVYACLGWNNGKYIFYTDSSGNPRSFLFHDYGDENNNYLHSANGYDDNDLIEDFVYLNNEDIFNYENIV